jgi:hypothetical protein
MEALFEINRLPARKVPERQGSRDKIAIQDLVLTSRGKPILIRRVGDDGEGVRQAVFARPVANELMHSTRWVK